MTFGTELVIDGEIKGNVTSSGALTVGEHARIFGDINVGSVTVKGTVQGNINAIGTLHTGGRRNLEW